MLASGRPVIATAHVGTELANVVADCGWVVEPENASAFAEAIHHLAQDAALRRRLGTAGRAYAEAHLDKQAVLAKFVADLLTLIG
jgi:colanic acid biosynthesis glycosyl transferase WcaI